MELCEFVAWTRPGYDKTGLQKKINELNDNFKARIHFLEIPALSISSTDIRNRLIAGKTIKYLLNSIFINLVCIQMIAQILLR